MVACARASQSRRVGLALWFGVVALWANSVAAADSETDEKQKLLLKIRAEQQDLATHTGAPSEAGDSPSNAEMAAKLKQLEDLVKSLSGSDAKEQLSGAKAALDNIVHHRWHGKSEEELHRLAKSCMLLALTRAGASRFSTKIAFNKIAGRGSSLEDVIHLDLMKYLAVCLFDGSDELLAQFEEDKVTQLPDWMVRKTQRKDFEKKMVDEIDHDLWMAIQEVAALGINHMHDELGYSGVMVGVAVLLILLVVGISLYQFSSKDKEKSF